MKVFIFVLSLLFVLVQIKAQGCPEACITLYNPVCGEAIINGRKVRCQFSNSCFMGVSGCRNNINWRATTLDKCNKESQECSRLR